jgi:pimeloyl-ACP methyl ester carboxylesterase
VRALTAILVLGIVGCAGPDDPVEQNAEVAPVPVEVSEGDFIRADDGARLYFEVVGQEGPVVLVSMHHVLRDALASSDVATGRRLVFYDPRNRGRSEEVEDQATLNMFQDVEDLERVRARVGAERVSVIGLGDFGKVAALYAARYPERVERIVQLAPAGRDPAHVFPPHLSAPDRVQVFGEGLKEISRLQSEGLPQEDPEAYCEAEWAITSRALMGVPSKADSLPSPCALEREWPVNLRTHFESASPANQRIVLAEEDLAGILAPTLVIHGVRDRHVPFGAGREWAAELAEARLLTLDNAAHFSWAEDRSEVTGAIGEFLDGEWPGKAEIIDRADPLKDPEEDV